MSERPTQTPNDPLDRVLERLPRDVAPGRDLWPEIRAQIETSSVPVSSRGAARYRMPLQLAAGVLIAITASLATYFATNDTQVPPTIAQTPASNEVQMPEQVGARALRADYVSTRASLDPMFAERMAALPPHAREKVEQNLADLRRAAQEISQVLEQHPSDPLLQELLMSTYQRELKLLADVTQLSAATQTSVEL